MKYIKCQFDSCSNPCQYKLGTWYFCKLHAKRFITDPKFETKNIFDSAFGTSYETDPYNITGISVHLLRMS